MKKVKFLKNVLSFVVCVVLIAAMGLALTSCGEETETPVSSSSPSSTVSETASSAPADGYGVAAKDIGSGSVSFIFRVTDAEGYDTLYRVYTDEKTVGAALIKYNLIQGEDGEYGLYVKTVNGITADYDRDKTYWAFYIDNEYAMTGVDSTEITPNAEYCFKIEKG